MKCNKSGRQKDTNICQQAKHAMFYSDLLQVFTALEKL